MSRQTDLGPNLRVQATMQTAVKCLRPTPRPRSFSAVMIYASVLLPLFLCVFILALARKWKRPALPYPPGPKGYPIFGNVLDLRMSSPIWENITALSNRHGTFQSRSVHGNTEAIL